MGKSYKKPIVKSTSKFAKNMSNSKFRKKTKQKIQEQRFDEIPEKEMEVTNQYNVVDQKYIFTEDDDYYEKSKRK